MNLFQDILRRSVRHKIGIAAFSFPKELDYGVFGIVYCHREGIILLQLLQVFQNERTVSGDLPQRQTSVHLRAGGAGIQFLFPDAIMYGAELVAEGRFCALYAAAGAVNHFR